MADRRYDEALITALAERKSVAEAAKAAGTTPKHHSSNQAGGLVI